LLRATANCSGGLALLGSPPRFLPNLPEPIISAMTMIYDDRNNNVTIIISDIIILLIINNNTTTTTTTILWPFIWDYPGETVAEENIHPLTPIMIINFLHLP